MKRSAVTVVAAAWLALVAVHAIAYTALPWVHPYGQRTGVGAANFRRAPSGSHWFGTDKTGRDVFSRCVYGARMTLLITVAAIAVAIVVATALGVLAGYRRGRVDGAVSAGTDVLLAFPPVILLLFLTASFDGRHWGGFDFTRKWLVVAGLILVAIPHLVRVIRASTMVEAGQDYVTAARAIGATDGRIVVRQLLPNLMPALITFAFTGLSLLIVAESGLAFVGQSVPPPEPTWGRMIADGRTDLDTLWWLSLMPAAVLFLTVLSCNLVGDWLSARWERPETRT
ncbi:MAG: transporter permease [Acidimicrobiia bacterium]|nr:transporter permease [Acidimicrobiia bacterium]